MKVVILILIVVGVGFLALFYARQSVETFDPVQQAEETKAKIEMGVAWTEILERAGDPGYWRKDSSNFDFVYKDRFGPSTPDEIRDLLDQGNLPHGFSFLYRFSVDATFAVNFDRNGDALNIQEKESQKDLMDAGGG